MHCQETCAQDIIIAYVSQFILIPGKHDSYFVLKIYSTAKGKMKDEIYKNYIFKIRQIKQKDISDTTGWY